MRLPDLGMIIHEAEIKWFIREYFPVTHPPFFQVEPWGRYNLSRSMLSSGHVIITQRSPPWKATLAAVYRFERLARCPAETWKERLTGKPLRKTTGGCYQCCNKHEKTHVFEGKTPWQGEELCLFFFPKPWKEDVLKGETQGFMWIFPQIHPVNLAPWTMFMKCDFMTHRHGIFPINTMRIWVIWGVIFCHRP